MSARITNSTRINRWNDLQ